MQGVGKGTSNLVDLLKLLMLQLGFLVLLDMQPMELSANVPGTLCERA